MNMHNLVVLFAESGYQISPDVLEWLCQLPDGLLRSILTQIKVRCPDTLVVTFPTIVEAIMASMTFDRVTFEIIISCNPEFKFRHRTEISPLCGGIHDHTR